MEQSSEFRSRDFVDFSFPPESPERTARWEEGCVDIKKLGKALGHSQKMNSLSS